MVQLNSQLVVRGRNEFIESRRPESMRAGELRRESLPLTETKFHLRRDCGSCHDIGLADSHGTATSVSPGSQPKQSAMRAGMRYRALKEFLR